MDLAGEVLFPSACGFFGTAVAVAEHRWWRSGWLGPASEWPCPSQEGSLHQLLMRSIRWKRWRPT